VPHPLLDRAEGAIVLFLRKLVSLAKPEPPMLPSRWEAFPQLIRTASHIADEDPMAETMLEECNAIRG
jgi:hypothetical protein